MHLTVRPAALWRLVALLAAVAALAFASHRARGQPALRQGSHGHRGETA